MQPSAFLVCATLAATLASASSQAQTVAPGNRGLPQAVRKVAAPAGELASSVVTTAATPLGTASSTQHVRRGQGDVVADQARRIQTMRSGIKAPASAAAIRATGMPGIRTVDGKAQLNFEPGGRYLIGGAGFGDRNGRVTLRPGGESRPIELKVITWNDAHVFVEVPADISGVTDHKAVELTVASPTGRPLTSNRFGFYAARALVALPRIPPAALRIDPTFLGDGLKVDYALGGPGGTFSVQRSMVDPDRSGCYEQPRDNLLAPQIPLAPGFEVHSLTWAHDALRNAQSSTTHETGQHAYALSWQDANTARLWSGVQRMYFKKQFDPVATIKWLSTMGLYNAFKPGQALCTSRYVVTVHAAGPRGVAPMAGAR